MMEDENGIRITHYVNPHFFYYRKMSSFLHNQKEKNALYEIDMYCGSLKNTDVKVRYKPKIGDIVGFLHTVMNRWIRIRIEHEFEWLGEDKSYAAFAIDDGFPVMAKLKYMRPLTQKLIEIPHKVIHRGAIAYILPSEQKYDFIEQELQSVYQDRWSENIVETLKDILEDANQINFNVVEMVQLNGGEILYLGEMSVLTHKNKLHKISEIINVAQSGGKVSPNEFKEKLFNQKTWSLKNYEDNYGNMNLKAPLFHSTRALPPKTKRVQEEEQIHMNNSNNHSKIQQWLKENEEVHESDFDESASQIKSPPTSVPKMYLQHEFRNLAIDESAPESKAVLRQKQITSIILGQPSSSAGPSHRPRPVMLDQVKESSEISYSTGLSSSKNPNSAQAIMSRLLGKTVASHNNSDEKVSFNMMPAGCDLGAVFAPKTTKIRANFNNAPSVSPPTREVEISPVSTLPRSVNDIVMSESGVTSPPKNSSDVYAKTQQRLQKKAYYEEEQCMMNSNSFQQVLVHGKRPPKKPIQEINEVFFEESVSNEVSKRFNKPFRIQSYSWPSITRKRSIFIVSSAQTAKTYGYLPAVCSNVREKYTSSKFKDDAGPIALIICKDSDHVTKVARTCSLYFLNSLPKIEVLDIAGLRKIQDTCKKLLNGCGVLITTAPCFKRLYEATPQAFSKRRLETLVIDDIDEIMVHFTAEIKFIFKTMRHDHLQFVLTSSTWQPAFLKIFELHSEMLLLIGAFTEAAVYGNASFEMAFMKHEKKAAYIRDKVKKSCERERTLIICSCQDEMVEVINSLKDLSILHMFTSDDMTIADEPMFKSWDKVRKEKFPVIVTCDEHVSGLGVTTAQHIIHYSLSHTWTGFTKRYSCSIDYYPDIIQGTEMEKPKATSLIILDEKSNEQLPKLLKFWKSHFPDQKINPIIEKVAQRVEWQQDQVKMDPKQPVKLCSFILEDGECKTTTTKCSYRHQFVPQDLQKPSFVRPMVHIRFEILEVESPVKYSVRILCFRNSRSDPWIKVHDRTEYMSNILRFSRYFNDEDNHKSHSSPKLRDLCVVKYANVFERAIVTDNSGNKNHIAVKLIDRGTETHVTEAELLHLPKQFHDFPSNIYDLHLPGLKPYDFEQKWDSTAKETVRSWLKGFENNNKCCIESQVLAATKEDIWANTILVTQFLNSAQTTFLYLDIRKKMVEHKFGVDEDNNMEMVLERIEELFKECRVHYKGFVTVDNEEEPKLSSEPELEPVPEPESKTVEVKPRNSIQKMLAALKPEEPRVKPSQKIPKKQEPELLIQFDAEPESQVVNEPLSMALSTNSFQRTLMELNSDFDQSKEPTTSSPQVIQTQEEPEQKSLQEILAESNTVPHLTNPLVPEPKSQIRREPVVKPLQVILAKLHGIQTVKSLQFPAIKPIDLNTSTSTASTSSGGDTARPSLNLYRKEARKNPNEVRPLLQSDDSTEELLEENTSTISETVDSDDYLTGQESITDSEDEELISEVGKFEEKFDELEEKINLKPQINFFLNPFEFYVTKEEHFSKVEKVISEFSHNTENFRPLKNFEVGVFCLIRLESVSRAKIVAIIGDNEAQIFLLDIGGHEFVKRDELFEMPAHILQMQPFCAVRCKMDFIKPVNDSLWDDDTSSRIFDILCEYQQNLVLRVLRPFNEETVTHIHINCYEVILMDDLKLDDPFCIIDHLVDANLAKVNDEERFYEFDENGEPVYSAYIDGNMFDREHLLRLLGGCSEDFQEPEKKVVQKIKKEVPPTEASIQTNPFKPHYYLNTSQTSDLPRLRSRYATAKTVWRQDKNFVHLKIMAPDVGHYDIEVDSDSMSVTFLEDGEKKMILINTFATIIPEHTMHDMKGLYIVVKLVKLVESMEWPSLMANDCKSQFISQIIEVDPEDESDDEDDDLTVCKDVIRNLTNFIPIEEGETSQRDSPINDLGGGDFRDVLALDL